MPTEALVREKRRHVVHYASSPLLSVYHRVPFPAKRMSAPPHFGPKSQKLQQSAAGSSTPTHIPTSFRTHAGLLASVIASTESFGSSLIGRALLSNG